MLASTLIILSAVQVKSSALAIPLPSPTSCHLSLPADCEFLACLIKCPNPSWLREFSSCAWTKTRAYCLPVCPSACRSGEELTYMHYSGDGVASVAQTGHAWFELSAKVSQLEPQLRFAPYVTAMRRLFATWARKNRKRQRKKVETNILQARA